MAAVDSAIPKPKALVVGSGPSGLILALSLRRNGIDVRVIEKSTEHRLGQRGAGIQPRSLELFESLGIYEQISARATGVPIALKYKMPEGVDLLKEFSMQPWEAPTPSIPFNNSVLLGQNNLDSILRAELARYGCEVELGVELQTFEQSNDNVRVTLRKHSTNSETQDTEPIIQGAVYDWVIGADGARGTVRRVLGLKLLGETTAQEMIVGDVELEGLAADKWHMWGDIPNDFISIRGTEDEGVFSFIIAATLEKNLEEICASRKALIETIRKFTGQRADIKLGNILWVSPYRLNIRMTETFHVGRVFLTGDAAHIHSPTGGQGMNTGVQDSFNLGWKLALVMKGVAPHSLLDTYNEERLPVVSNMLNITTQILKKTLENVDDAGWDRTGPLKQLGVNYRWSSIVVDEENEAQGKRQDKLSTYGNGVDSVLSAGDRAPDATGLVEVIHGSLEQNKRTTRLFQLFSPAKHTVLLFSNAKVGYQATSTALKNYPTDCIQLILVTAAGESTDITVKRTRNTKIVEDTEAHALHAYNSAEGAYGLFVIRPDGIVGARIVGVEGMNRYFRTIFGNTS